MDNRVRIKEAIKTVTENKKIGYSHLIEEAETVCVFGTGTMMTDAIDSLKERTKIHIFCDNDPEKWNKEFFGIKCVNPEELKEYKGLLVIIAVSAYKEVSEQLQNMGIKYINYFNVIWDSSKETVNPKWLENAEDKVLKAYDLFDEESREIFTELFCNRIEPLLAHREYKDLMKHEIQYFDKGIVKLTENEVFVDCGAFDGDTIREFFNNTNNCCDKVYGFELDPENYRRLQTFKERYGHHKEINVFNLGVWNEDTEFFSNNLGNMETRLINGTDSQRGMEASLVALDSFLKEQKITFIKMDIEGAEINALRGARRILKEQQPQLAICIYHKLADLWEIPLLIHEINPQYQFKLGHYKPHWAETVCYGR